MIKVPRDKHKSLRMSCLKFSHSSEYEVTRSLCISAQGNVNSNNYEYGVAELPGHVIGIAADGDFNIHMPRIAPPFVHIQYEFSSFWLPTGFCVSVCSDYVKVQ